MIYAFGLLMLALGMVIGYELGKKPVKEAPATDYDASNPINARGRRGEIVEICGHPFVRMN